MAVAQKYCKIALLKLGWSCGGNTVVGRDAYLMKQNIEKKVKY